MFVRCQREVELLMCCTCQPCAHLSVYCSGRGRLPIVAHVELGSYVIEKHPYSFELYRSLMNVEALAVPVHDHFIV
jgi:hypothetical protein